LSLPPAPSPTTQAAVSTAGTTLLKRQFNGYGGSYLPPINVILIAGIDPTVGNWSWTSVDVPQGWYQIYANVQNTVQTTSSPFFVQNGTITGCVVQFAAPSTAANSSSTSHPVATNIVAPSHHSNAGAIAGGVIGGIAFLAVAFVAFLFLCLRRRTSRSQHHDEDGGARRWSELSFRKSRPDNTRSSTQKTLPVLEGEQTITGSDEEMSTLAHEKAIAAGQSPPQLPPHQPHQPIRTHSLRNSTQTTGSYGRGATNPESPGAPSSYNAFTGEAIQLERTNTAGGSVRPRRKPAPHYEGGAEGEEQHDGRSSSQTTLDFVPGNSTKGSPDSAHILQHKSSFGAVRPMHVMITDPPARSA